MEEFKIDTKATYSVLTPLIGIIDANLAGIIRQNCEKTGQSGSLNYIIDFQHCQEIDGAAIPALIKLHEYQYENSHSFVLTGINAGIMNIFKKNEIDLLLNIAMTMQEAIDIVSMEILERDLFNEES